MCVAKEKLSSLTQFLVVDYPFNRTVYAQFSLQIYKIVVVGSITYNIPPFIMKELGWAGERFRFKKPSSGEGVQSLTF